MFYFQGKLSLQTIDGECGKCNSFSIWSSDQKTSQEPTFICSQTALVVFSSASDSEYVDIPSSHFENWELHWKQARLSKTLLTMSKNKHVKLIYHPTHRIIFRTLSFLALTACYL